MKHSNSIIPRTWIIVLQVLGTVFATAALSTYIYYFGYISDSIVPGEDYSKILAAMILAILFYLTWKTVYAAVVIIRFIGSASDEDISNNRYILSALSLNLGGFVTPFILTSLPNVDVQSDINPRWFLTRVMGITSLVGAILALIAFYVSALTGTAAFTSQQLFDINETAGQISVILLTLELIIIAFGTISIGMFYGKKNSLEIFEEKTTKTSYATGMHVIAYIWMVVLTVELVVTMILAIVRLIGAVIDLIDSFTRSNNGFMGFLYILLSLANVVLTLLYTFWVLEMTWRTIIGLWSKKEVHYKTYKNLESRQKELKQRK